MTQIERESSRKFHRVLALLTLIQGQTGWNAKRLSIQLEVDERTIYRYLDDLELIGVPYYFDQETNGYRVRRDFFLPPVQMTPEEALALAVLCDEVAGREQIPFLQPAWRAVAKLEALLPESIRQELGRLEGHVTIQTASPSPAEGWQDVYSAICAAISSRRAVACVYETGGNDEECFEFEPYALFFSVRAWYAVGLHCGRSAVRSLKISRFLSCKLTPRTFELPQDFSMDRHLGNAWRMIRGDKDYLVEIRFDPSFTPTMSDTQWHRTQEIEFNGDGSSIFRCTVSGLDEIVWWVLGMGPHCTVTNPPELVERVRDLASRTAALYPKP